MDKTPTTPAPSSKLRTFLRRLLSTIVLWSVIIAAMFFTTKLVADLVFLAIVTLLAAFGLAEFYGLAKQRGIQCYKGWGILGGVLLMVATSLHFNGVLGITGTPSRVNDFETSFLIIFVLGLCLRQFVSLKNTTGLMSISVTMFGLMYVPWLLNFLQKIYYFPSLGDNGAYYIIYFILVTKLSDSGAYAIGSLIGKHKMIPRISPGKTWEGFGGALFGSTVASVVFWSCARGHLPGMNALHAAILGLLHAAILGLLLGGAAVVGDLIESLFKREAGVKDSGSYFPGIGGILDLLDSLLFNAPIMYLYLRHILKNPLFNG
jgi:phosphatidate cytidylyltransferase